MAQQQLPAPIAFTRIRGTGTDQDATLAAKPQAGFALLVAMAATAAVESGATPGVVPVASPGETLVFDLRTEPSIRFAGPYDFVRFLLPAATLDRLADDGGLPRVRGLRTSPARVQDPVMNGLALSLLPALDAPRTAASRFLDCIGLAFHAHVIRSYGCPPETGSKVGCGLAAWQLRRMRALAEARLEGPLSIAELANECRLSASQFTRRFVCSIGMSPHRWLTARRIERAKGLLLVKEELSQIALACGFVDQSHFNRAFKRLEGQSPGRWRREHRQ